MKSSKLLLKIRKNLKRYESKLNRDISENKDSIHHIMSNYNRDNFYEIINLSFIELEDEIDEKKLKEFQRDINYYLRLHAPDNEKFKDFIEMISIYLVFIAKKPLHPPGTVFSNGKGVYKKDNVYFCTGKNVFIKENKSLCKYCICKQFNDK